MARTWLIDSRALARKVKNATLSPANQISDCGANRECPNCHYSIDNSDVSHEWPGLPAGVKFDPSDVQLLEHLAAKCGIGNSKPHLFIDEFIPTLENDNGICYTHPENLPGAKIDGSSVHFFHRTIKAYATGQRKRRKIHSQHGLTNELVRWHKTGKTKLVMENGVWKGWKKIMVLYKTSAKGSKPGKSNWVMHQYHLGPCEDEKEGEYVVSKIFYQHLNSEKNNNSPIMEGIDFSMTSTSPKTPKTNTPIPPRPVSCDDVIDDNIFQSSAQVNQISHPTSSTSGFKDETAYPIWLAGESQAIDLDAIDDSLLCNEEFSSYTSLNDPGLHYGPSTAIVHNANDVPRSEKNTTCGIADLENLELDTPPDFQLADLQFASQDSVFDWLDRL